MVLWVNGLLKLNSHCFQGYTLEEGEHAVSHNLVSTNHVLFGKKRSAEGLWLSRTHCCRGNARKWFCNAASVGPAGVQIRTALPSPSFPPPLPPRFPIPTLLISTTHLSLEQMGRLITPNIPNTPESYSLAGAVLPSAMTKVCRTALLLRHVAKLIHISVDCRVDSMGALFALE